MRFGILGSLDIADNGHQLSLGGRKQRILLAVLLLHAGEAVPRDRLIEAVWDGRPPPSADVSLDTYVHRLRKLLGPERITRGSGGYAIHVEPEELDSNRFEQLIEKARHRAEAGDHAAAAGALRAALGLWRGPAWADVPDDPDAGVDARRLEELRLCGLESRIEADLAVGGGAELVPELEPLVSEHPLRERLLASLMLALYRAGRHTEALEEFTSARRRLVEELGLEPSPALHELQRRILRHDPGLAAARGARPRRRPRTGPGYVAAAIAAALLALALVLGMEGPPGAMVTLNRANGILVLDAASGRPVIATDLAGAPGAVGVGAGSIWVADPGDNMVSRLDPATGVVTDQIPASDEPGSVVSGDGAIWAASTVGARIVRIDPTTEVVTQTISLPGSSLSAVAFGDRMLWAADQSDRLLFEVDPASGSLLRTLVLPVQPSAAVFAGSALWVAGYDNATVDRIDPRSGATIASVRVGDGPVALVVASGSLWVANSLDGTVSRIDPLTRSVLATIPVGSGPTALAASDRSVWVANRYSANVSRIDPRHDQAKQTVDTGGTPIALSARAGRVWVAVAAPGGSHRGGTLVIATLNATNPLTPRSVDPGQYSDATKPQFIGLAYDDLVDFQQSAGAAGLRLVPDLALAIPVSFDRGRSYTFRLRPGIRYSDGQLVRARDFRRGVERLFRIDSEGTSLYSGLVGADRCAERPRTCDLSQGIVADDALGTVTYRVSSPDPDFLFKLTVQGYGAPIPPGTPDRETGTHTVPGTGPYEAIAVSDKETRFIRNPFFREWSHAAQPNGDPNVIVWQTVPSEQTGISKVTSGRTDWWFGSPTAAQYTRLELQDPSQVHSNPVFGVEFVPLNTRLPPFNDVRVRRALNFAIDRAHIAELYGGPSFATPTCQTIAPGLLGYRGYCPYTLHPRADGAWTAPDLARGRRLVAASGTRGERIEVWGSPDEGYIPATTPSYVANVLRQLGYRVTLKMVPFASITQAMRLHFQLSVDGDWVADYPDPSSYVPPFFGCGGGHGNDFYCNPRLDRTMQTASQRELTDPAEAERLWQSVDRELTDQAVWVPTETPREIDVTSSRLRNYEYNPVSGFLPDQAWLQ